MTEPEVEKVVLDTVRRYALKDAVGVDARFEQDLGMSEVGRQNLFASVAQAFSARGVGLASNGFLLRDFLACDTPAAVRDAIREKVFGKSGAAPARPAGPAKPAAPAASAAPAPALAPPASQRKAKAKTPSKRASAPKKNAAAGKAQKRPRKRT